MIKKKRIVELFLNDRAKQLFSISLTFQYFIESCKEKDDKFD